MVKLKELIESFYPSYKEAYKYYSSFQPIGTELIKAISGACSTSPFLSSYRALSYLTPILRNRILISSGLLPSLATKNSQGCPKGA